MKTVYPNPAYLCEAQCFTQSRHTATSHDEFDLDLDFQASAGNFKLNGRRWPLKSLFWDSLESSVGLSPSPFLPFAFTVFDVLVKNQSFCHSRMDHTFLAGGKTFFLLELMVTNAYQGRFVLLRIKVITYNRKLTFYSPSNPTLFAKIPLRNNTRLLRLDLQKSSPLAMKRLLIYLFVCSFIMESFIFQENEYYFN